jgi:hypothetical protein
LGNYHTGFGGAVTGVCIAFQGRRESAKISDISGKIKRILPLIPRINAELIIDFSLHVLFKIFNRIVKIWP